MGSAENEQDLQKFKLFVQRYPGIIKKVRNGDEKWQNIYEKWVLLGEDDPSWQGYNDLNSQGNSSKNSSKSKKQDWMKQMSNVVEKIDINKVEGHINQLNGAVANIQSLIGQFQEMKKQANVSKTPSYSNQPNHRPFHFYRD